MKMLREVIKDVHIVQYHGCGSIKEEDPHEKERPDYQNIRARSWFSGQRRARDGKACISNDEELKEDLMEVKYFVNKRGLIQIEDKTDIKERLGGSPNKGDAWNMLQWGFEQNYPKIIIKEDQPRDRQGQGELMNANAGVSRPFKQ